MISHNKLNDGSIAVEATGTGRIMTLEELLEAADVNLDQYYVDRWKANSWETHFRGQGGEVEAKTNFQVRASLVNKAPEIGQYILEEIKDVVLSHKPRYRAVSRKELPTDTEHFCLVVDLFDLHVSMLAWAEETGEDAWDSKIAVKVAVDAVKRLLSRVQGYPISTIVFPMGNDLLHADATFGGSGGSTNKGTPVDVDTRYLKSFRTALLLMVEIIDLLRCVAPVECVVIPGNHDQERVQYLGEAVWAWYRDTPDVTINNNAQLRKYLKFGDNLLGFTHGDKEPLDKLPLLMAAEQPEAWADTDFRTFHTGHLHIRKRGITWTTDTFQGVEVKVIPSLIPPDAWHASKGYVASGRSVEAHIYGESEGYVGMVSYNLPRKTQNQNNTQLVVVR